MCLYYDKNIKKHVKILPANNIYKRNMKGALSTSEILLYLAQWMYYSYTAEALLYALFQN